MEPGQGGKGGETPLWQTVSSWCNRALCRCCSPVPSRCKSKINKCGQCGLIRRLAHDSLSLVLPQMLTVPEQLLLITLDAGTGAFMKLPEEYNRAAFAGAALMELALAGRIDSDLDKVWVVNPVVTGDAALDPVLSAMSALEASTDIERFVDRLVPLGARVREAALDSLCHRGVLERSEQKSLFRKPRASYALLDNEDLAGLKARLRDVLIGSAVPEPSDVCIMTLAKTCGLIDCIIGPEDMRAALDRLEAFSNTDLIGQTVRRYLYLFERDIARS